MTSGHSPPPLRALAPGRQRELKEHLLREIEGQVYGLDAEPRRGRRRRFTRRVGLATTAGALLLLAAILSFRGGTDTATAAQVRQKLAEGLQLNQTVSGRFEVEARDPGTPPRGVARCRFCAPQVPLPSAFVVASDGSYLSRTDPAGASSRRDVAYDAASGVQTSYATPVDPAGRAIYLRAVNLDPELIEYAPEARLGISMQGALSAGDPGISEVTFDGRTAWKATTTFEPGENLYDLYGARVDVVVDKETGLVLQVTQYAYDPDRWTSVATVRDLEIGGSTTGTAFTVPKPANVAEHDHDYGFRRVPVSAAAATIGYQPLLPEETGGRPLTDFAVAKTSEYPFPGLPPRRDVASARYGTGAASVTVSTYRGPVSDLPLLLPGGADSETIDLSDGALAGSDAYASTPTLSAAVVVAFADGLLVRITAPTTAEALAVASSLSPAD